VLKSNGFLFQTEDDIILKHSGNDSYTTLNKFCGRIKVVSARRTKELYSTLFFSGRPKSSTRLMQRHVWYKMATGENKCVYRM
jgi:hypothetical protein